MKERLDIILKEKGFFPTEEKAQAAIMEGIVYVDGQKVDKAGTPVKDTADICIKDDRCPYVSRGGFKLEKAVNQFGIDLKGCICTDIGASTGGFTDFMLKNGAEKVYAIDVGYGQLDYKLRTDPRVVNMEKTNIRHLDVSLIKDAIDFISIDVSFISLKLVLPVASAILKDGGSIICLVKPQFEAERDQVGRKGIVRDRNVHEEVLVKAVSYGRDNGLSVSGITFSPITGAKGNIEYLVHFIRSDAVKSDTEIYEDIKDTVSESHDTLEKI